MKGTIVAIGLMVGAVALWGCGNSGSPGTPGNNSAQGTPSGVKPGEEEALMPLSEDSQWTYNVDRTVTTAQGQQRNSYLLTYRVVKSEKTADGTKATLETSVDGKLNNRQVLLLNSKGLYELAGGLELKPYPTPQILVPFPPATNQKFEWKGPGLIAEKKEGTLKLVGTVLGPQTVDSEAGSFNAIAVEQRIEPDGAERTFVRKTTTWYAPNVGLVRWWDDRAEKNGTMTTILKLKTYSLKK